MSEGGAPFAALGRRGNPNNLVGVIQAWEILAASLKDEPLAIRKAPIIPDTLDALDALKVIWQAEVPMALVHDEYGYFNGVVTPADILDIIAGAFHSVEGEAEPEAVQCFSGRWAVSLLEGGRACKDPSAGS